MLCPTYDEHAHPDGSVWERCDEKHCDELHEVRVAVLEFEGSHDLIPIHHNPDAATPMRKTGRAWPFMRWATETDLRTHSTT